MNHMYKLVFLMLSIFLLPQLGFALTLDWSGYFRADNNYIRNYQLSKVTENPNSVTGDEIRRGEYIEKEGERTSTYTTFFARFKPTALVNDNIIIRSEWNIGDPVLGFFGRNINTDDTNNPTTTERGSLTINASRLWMDAHTDFGMVQVGRAPMHWGIGAIYNDGNDVWSRYQSTSDTIRLISKFGYLSLMPLYAKVSVGNNISGAQDSTGAALSASDDVTDYGIALKFDNPEEELEAGVLLIKRNATDQQGTFFFPDSATSFTSGGANGINLKLIDLYAKKTWHRLTLAFELPIYSGEIGNVNNSTDISGNGVRNNYKATGFVSEVDLKFDNWRHSLRFGLVPGQESQTKNTQTNSRNNDYQALYLHRNYKLGQILFNYNFNNFASNNPDTLDSIAATSTSSPYDASITNAKYLMYRTEYMGEQWSVNLAAIYAIANETAKTGQDYWNHSRKLWFDTAAEDQDDSLGLELDLGTRYTWDKFITFGADFGVFFPGSFYEFVDSASFVGETQTVYAISFNAAASF